MERSKQLHNFDFPPGLTWGRQSLLRCMNVNPIRAMQAIDEDYDDESSDSGDYNQNARAGQPRSIDDFDGQKRLGSELNSSSSATKESEDYSPPLKSKSKRKLKSKMSLRSPSPIEERPARPRRNFSKEERPKFSIQLSRKEIEEDFIAMTGKKPPRKPNKPPKSVQSKLDALSPGLWLSEVHPDRYKVNENGKI